MRRKMKISTDVHFPDRLKKATYLDIECRQLVVWFKVVYGDTSALVKLSA